MSKEQPTNYLDYNLEDDVYICKYNQPDVDQYEHSLFIEIYNDNFNVRDGFGGLDVPHLINIAERYGFENDMILEFSEFVNCCERELSKKRNEDKPK